MIMTRKQQIVTAFLAVLIVASVMSMPEFPDSLLILMGISNGTYLSLKIPEKP